METRVDSPRTRRCQKIFDQAIELPPHRRRAFVDEICGDDDPLRQEVLGLLAYDADSTSLGIVALPRADMNETLVEAMPEAPLAMAPSLAIGHYELIREIGRGAMGTVYLARDITLGRRVAIKFLQRVEPKFQERFILEARTTARCSHENIVVIHEVSEHQKQPFMVLEYLRGKPLSQVISGQVMAPGRAVELMLPVVRALVCAHTESIVHRDLKPDNIFVTATGHIKVLDFGIAKYLRRPQQLELLRTQASTLIETNLGLLPHTQSGTIIGTLRYMSPEQWGVGEVDHRSDLWAVGIMLFEMVTGHHPLHPRRGLELSIVSHLDMPMPAVRALRPDIPDRLAELIDQCLAKYKEKRVANARKLLAELEKLRPRGYTYELSSGESPYTGLKAFQERDAQRFFGRGREISCMLAQIRDQPLLTVVGPSGVGKSSLVRAGVIPALKGSGEPWDAIVIRPGRQPMAALAGVVAPMIQTATVNLAEALSKQEAIARHLYREPGYLGVVLRTRASSRQGKTLIFIDQFEELYTLVADPRERAAFTACLRAVADDAASPLRIMLSIRADFLYRVAEDQAFMAELMAGLFFLAPPERHGLREVLIQPAEMAGYHFESDDLVESMLDCLQDTPGALPLLQFAATKLWELRDQERRLLTRESYQRIGGVDGALASHADQVLQSLAPRHRELVRAVFLRLVTAESTRALATTEELWALSAQPGEVQGLVDYLIDARLLVVQSGEGGQGATVEIVHESLIHSWPQLRHWLDESKDDVLFLERLRASAIQWHRADRPVGLLWGGEAATDAARWARRHRDALPDVQRHYLDAVLALALRARRNRRLIIIGIMGFLSILTVASASVALMIRDAQQETLRQAQNYASALDDIRTLTDSLGDKDRDYAQRVREILAQAEAASTIELPPDHLTAASPRTATSAASGAAAPEQAAALQRERDAAFTQLDALRISLDQALQAQAAAQATIVGHEQRSEELEGQIDALKKALEQQREHLSKLGQRGQTCAVNGTIAGDDL
jgi:serine/threonine protein kinase